jgi:hypothetical protein
MLALASLGDDTQVGLLFILGKHSSLFCPIVSDEEKNVIRHWLQLLVLVEHFFLSKDGKKSFYSVL